MLLNQDLIWLGEGIIAIWLLVLTVFLYRTIAHYRRLTKNTDKNNLEQVLENLLQEGKQSREITEALTKRAEKIEKEGLGHISKIGLVRFNPFADTGGSQSFTLAVLDGNNSGILISSLHSRDQTRIYAKQVKEGKGVGFELSQEEKEAIAKAQK